MPLTKADYVALAAFRAALRRFLLFSESAARAVGLSPQQHQLLLAVKGQPGRDWSAVGEIAAGLGVRHHTAVGLVDRCVELGLVKRRREGADRRVVQVWLSPKGARLLERLSRQNRRELEALRKALRMRALVRREG